MQLQVSVEILRCEIKNYLTIHHCTVRPLMSGVHVAPFAYCHRCGCKDKRRSPEDCCDNPLLAVENLLKQQSAAAETAAILLVRGHLLIIHGL